MLASSKRKRRRAWLLGVASESQRAEKTVLQDLLQLTDSFTQEQGLIKHTIAAAPR